MKVTFLVLKTGAVVSKEFDSPYACRQFINKARHSKTIRLIFVPNLDR